MIKIHFTRNPKNRREGMMMLMSNHWIFEIYNCSLSNPPFYIWRFKGVCTCSCKQWGNCFGIRLFWMNFLINKRIP